MNCSFKYFFRRFHLHYPSITSYDAEVLTFFSDEGDEGLASMKESVLELCKSLLIARTKLTDELFVRGDYRELVQLVVFYLGGGGEKLLVFHRPGAKHHSRWMSKLLYSIKMVMLRRKIEQELPKNAIFFKGQADKLVRFVHFIVLCYVPWWLTAPVASLAPHNDFVMLKTLREYRLIDAICSLAAIEAFSRHFWYLTQELVVLVLFSSAVDLEVKAKMLEKLRTHPATSFPTKRFGNYHGKPSFPKQSDIDTEGDLSQFIGSDSMFFFSLMCIPHSLLEKPVCLWENDPHYRQAKETVDHLLVVNDSAERGVKLANDFIDTTKDELRYQNILQVVENSRGETPDQRRREKCSKRWYLQL